MQFASPEAPPLVNDAVLEDMLVVPSEKRQHPGSADVIPTSMAAQIFKNDENLQIPSSSLEQPLISLETLQCRNTQCGTADESEFEHGMFGKVVESEHHDAVDSEMMGKPEIGDEDDSYQIDKAKPKPAINAEALVRLSAKVDAFLEKYEDM